MSKDKKESNKNHNVEQWHVEQLVEGEDTTRYGEFITSYFAWLTLDRQKTNAEEMEKMTNKDNENK